MTTLYLLFVVVLSLCVNDVSSQSIIGFDTTVATFSGNAKQEGSSDGDLASATFDGPTSISLNYDNTIAILSDERKCVIRKIDITSGVVSTIGGHAGNCSHVDGLVDESRFDQPLGTSFSPDGNYVVVVDQGGKGIRRYVFSDNSWETVVSPANGVLKQARGIAIDKYGSFALVAEQHSSVVIKFSLEDWSLFEIVCGINGTKGFKDGKLSEALLSDPVDIIISRDSQSALFSDGNAIRKLDILTGTLTTLAGHSISGFANGNNSEALFSGCTGLSFLFSSSEKYVAIVDTGNQCLRLLDVTSGVVKTLAGNCSAGEVDTSDGQNFEVRFDYPSGLAMWYADEIIEEEREPNKALIVQNYVIRMATFYPNEDSTSAAAPSSFSLKGVLVYVILVSVIMVGLAVYIVYDHHAERSRANKYRVINRLVEIRTRSVDNLLEGNEVAMGDEVNRRNDDIETPDNTQLEKEETSLTGAKKSNENGVDGTEKTTDSRNDSAMNEPSLLKSEDRGKKVRKKFKKEKSGRIESKAKERSSLKSSNKKVLRQARSLSDNDRAAHEERTRKQFLKEKERLENMYRLEDKM